MITTLELISRVNNHLFSELSDQSPNPATITGNGSFKVQGTSLHPKPKSIKLIYEGGSADIKVFDVKFDMELKSECFLKTRISHLYRNFPPF